MTDRDKEQARKDLNKELKPTLDKEQLRDLDPKTDDQDKLRGGMACPRTRAEQ